MFRDIKLVQVIMVINSARDEMIMENMMTVFIIIFENAHRSNLNLMALTVMETDQVRATQILLV